MSTLTRRSLLQALAMFGATAPLVGRALAQGSSARGKTLITIFLRGGLDGLAAVAPVGDPALALLRPSLLSKGPSLDGYFHLHAGLADLKPWFDSKRLAVLHAVGQVKASRSHFDAQDALETGMAGQRGHDGYLNRASAKLGDDPQHPFRVVALQNTLPTSLGGDGDALALASLKDFRVPGGPGGAASFESLYADAVDQALRETGKDAFDSLGQSQAIAALMPANGANYPKSPLGKRLQDLARLVRADVGLRVGVTETGGFDTHLAQGADTGTLFTRLKDLSDCLVAFATDLGPKLDDVLVLTVTEFGRTAKENGTHGTDHGTASAMFALGGGVRGGRVLSAWPGLAVDQLFEQRDLAVTCDVRSVLAEALEGTLGVRELFPDFTPRPVGLWG
jgi:uncharacterized protein (DUF1501 family)